MNDNIIPATEITFEMRYVRQKIFKIIKNKDPKFSADVIHWIYVDILLNNFPYEKVMESAKGSQETIERCARRYFKKEN